MGAEHRGGAHHRSARGHTDAAAVDVEVDLHIALACRGTEIGLGVEVIDHCAASVVVSPKSAGKYLRALATG